MGERVCQTERHNINFDKGYEFRKYEPLKHIKNKIVMGDLIKVRFSSPTLEVILITTSWPVYMAECASHQD